MTESVVKTGFDPADIAYGIIDEYLLEGPEYLDISEAVLDNGGSDDDTEAVALIVRKSLTEIARTFYLTY